MSRALVPLQRVRFGGGRSWPTPYAYLGVEPLPRNTLDRRYAFCHQHRTACLCREADLAETIAEYRYELNSVREAALDALVGHRLFDWSTRDNRAACQCTGCQLIRAADVGGLIAHTDDHGVVMPRDPEAAARRLHRQGSRPDGTWGCLCGWEQDKPHAEHVADMVAAARADSNTAPNGDRS